MDTSSVVHVVNARLWRRLFEHDFCTRLAAALSQIKLSDRQLERKFLLRSVLVEEQDCDLIKANEAT